MKHLQMIMLAAIVAASPLTAQDKPAEAPPEAAQAKRKATVPMLAVLENKRLAGADKMRYVLRQLKLDDEQLQFARDLLDTIYQDGDAPQLSLPEIHAMVAEIQKAKEDGDEQRVKALGQQLRDMATRSDRDVEFMLNMETVLSDKQKTAMEGANQRLKRNPSGAVRPIDVIRCAKTLGLSSKQLAEVGKFGKMLRDDQNRNRRRKLDDQWRFQTINYLVSSIDAILTDEQRPVFATNIRRLRPDLAARLTVRPAGEQPTGD